jgi:hypothetical protein
MDRWRHNLLFANELVPAFAELGIPVHVLDYRTQPREVSQALRDAACSFFFCFNGFGSELQLADGEPGRLRSAFEYYGKPLFDLMHDCPAHESMAHQVHSTFPRRCLLLTDYAYVAVARSLGVRNARFVPSITFPAALPGPAKPLAERSIDILLPIGLQESDASQRRHRDGSPRSRVYRCVFEAVSEACVANLQLDPLHELAAACQDAGVAFDLREPDARFLLTTVLDHVKAERRTRLLRAIAHLPVTVMSAGPLGESDPGSRLRFVSPRSVAELLATMADARSVICPLPHMTGYHERATGALTAGSVVIAAPNHLLETEFICGRDLLIYRTEQQLVGLLETVLDDPASLAPLAERGRQTALARLAPGRLAGAIVSLLALER